MTKIKELDNIKPIQCFKINFNGVDEYTKSKAVGYKAKTTDSLNLDSFLVVNSDFIIDGLKSLYNSLNSSANELDSDTIKNFRTDLLADLERLSKRQSFSDKHNAPIFKEDFAREIHKLPAERSSDFREFLRYCSTPRRGAMLNSLEAISAKMLLALDDENLNTDVLQQQLKSELDKYKKDYQEQVTKDFGDNTKDGRETILLKDRSGMRMISAKELQQLPSLTGEQKDYLKTCWQQSVYGWLAIAANTNDLNNKLGDIGGTMFNYSGSRNALVVDVSDPDKVLLSSRSSMQILTALENGKKTYTNCAGDVLEVDISALKGKDFIPGCASANPPITAYISTFDPQINFKLSGEFVKQSPEFDRKRQYLVKDLAAIYLREIASNSQHCARATSSLIDHVGKEQTAKIILQQILTSSLDDREKKDVLHKVISAADDENFFDDAIKILASKMIAKEQIKSKEEADISNLDKNFMAFLSTFSSEATQGNSPLTDLMNKIATLKEQQNSHTGLKQAQAVRHYTILEENSKKRENFASKQLRQYCGTLYIKILNEKETTNISNAIVDILAPICKNNLEKALLESNAHSLVREYASQKGIEMSLGQKLLTYLIDPIKRLFGHDKKMEQFIKPAIERSFRDKVRLSNNKQAKESSHLR